MIVGAEHSEVSEKHGIAFRRSMPAGVGKADGGEAAPAHGLHGRQDLFTRVVFHGAARLFRQIDMGVHVIHGMHADFVPVPADVFQQAQLFLGEEMKLIDEERGMGVIAAEQIEGAVPFLDAVVVKGDGHAGPGGRRTAARGHCQGHEQGPGGDSRMKRGFHAGEKRGRGTPVAPAGDPESRAGEGVENEQADMRDCLSQGPGEVNGTGCLAVVLVCTADGGHGRIPVDAPPATRRSRAGVRRRN